MARGGALMRLKNQKGVVLATVLLFIIVLLLLGAALSMLSVNSHLQTMRMINKEKAFYAARAGADALRSYIVDNPDGLTAEELMGYVDAIIAEGISDTGSVGGNSFKLQVRKSDDGSSIEIKSTGTAGNMSSEVTYLIEIAEGEPSGPVLDMAVFATKQRERRFHKDKKGKIVYDEPTEALSLDGSAYIKGPVGTNSIENGTVKFDWSTKVYGDVNIGPEGDVGTAVIAPSDMDSYVISPGTRKLLPAEREYPLPVFPAFPDFPSKGDFTAGWWPAPPYTLPLADGDAWYSSLEVLSTLKIEVGSGTRRLRIDNLEVTGAGKIEIVGSGKLELYVSNFIMDNSGRINDLGNPGQVHMYYNGTSKVNLGGDTRYFGSIYIKDADLDITNSGGIQGHVITGGSTVNITGDASAFVRAIYAPNAHVYMGGSGKVKGSIIANSFFMDGGTWVEYVAATEPIPDIPTSGPGKPKFQNGRWK